ncbi:potassium-transporting ATPase subunit KdpC [Ohtaekwangia koreensis]|uniref:Potassium-transporting ATPase KdpC subunit n=1 Tax=Ohtaekwangia koreensis TaxID=688867 RepID=A0A1T5MC38_9BACT|nr:potassium-transporting ATPase subunit KdpC [Ohtaekwangia koreensis]SKC85449.1 K+-transporting ATPase ATPase C chain [Ohtaekwangia koreensis]
MKNQNFPAILLSLCCLVFFCGIYTAAVWAVAQVAPNQGKGKIIFYGGNSQQYGFANIGQAFTVDKYFWSRPSAVNYNAAGSGGSNKGAGNPEYLLQVQARIDTFLLHNPAVKRDQIPTELVTASGSGLDPHLSPGAAHIQVERIAKIRGIPKERLNTLLHKYTHRPWFGVFGIETVNVLELNIALDQMK